MIEICEITKNDDKLLQEFLKKATEARKSFRYFETRDISILKNHLYTILALDNGNPVGYGHLDVEGSVWLGICVADAAQGKGIGRLIMADLIKVAKEKKVEKVKLSVDKDNSSAIHLYQKNGFEISDSSKESYLFMELNTTKSA